MINVTEAPHKADPSGLKDATAVIQAAIIAAQTRPGSARVYIPAGTYLITAPLIITAPIVMFGDGIGSTTLIPASGINCITINCADSISISDLSIAYPSPAATNTAARIVTSPNVGAGFYGNSSSIFRDLRIINAYISIHFVCAQAFVVDNIKSELHSSAGIYIENQRWPDAGDSKIVNCYIEGAGLSTTTAGIVWTGDGAVDISHNTIVTHQYGILVELQAGASTRQMFITSNTIDGASVAGIAFWPLGSGLFGGVIITSNILNLCHYGLSIGAAPIGQWIKSLIFNDNNWYDDGKAGAVMASIASVATFTGVGTIAESTGPSTACWLIANGVTGVISSGSSVGAFTVPNKIPAGVRVI